MGQNQQNVTKFQSRFAYVIRQNEAGAKGPQQKIWFFAFFECSHTIEQLLFSSLGQAIFFPGCMFRLTVVPKTINVCSYAKKFDCYSAFSCVAH